MPWKTHRLCVTLPRDVPSKLQWRYDTVRALENGGVKKTGTDNPSVVGDENLRVDHNRAAGTEVAGGAPYRRLAGREEAVAKHPKQAVMSSDTPSTAKAAVDVELPNLEAEVHQLFPTAAAIPPPPPTTTGSLEAVHFWYRRLLGHPIYERCVRFVSFECPAPPTTDNKAKVLAWAKACEYWWDALSSFVRCTSLLYKLPSDKAWNPYSFSQPITYARGQPAHRDIIAENAAPTVSSTKFFIPPPPSSSVVLAEYRLIADEADAQRSYVACLTVWWRKACQWAAVSNRKYAWLNPPPTTGSNAEDWALRCEQWRTFTASQLREEERRAKAAELEAMMATYQLQQMRLSESTTSSNTTFSSQLNQPLVER
ncbi:hypothetical protein ABL78_0058 [Leptomonas seymouri]|uniref:Uncharacterized protein n=1 Tax=Leptomonas seymouri TaxID=5684 RepID=A0A0N1PFP3_LEPSE|nr:hypothetical protein ABL78_0058 [Leptomonas seymouri]|eukprot:KPI90825.1 hypothetical protein ABL78_0058 [Leptomonas seymouri]